VTNSPLSAPSANASDGSDTTRRQLQVAGAIITNGLIKLGVNKEGSLNIPGGKPTNSMDGRSETRVGLRYIFPDGSESEATSYGCTCEGWGVGANGESVYFNTASGNVGSSVYTNTFTYTGSTARSTLEYKSRKLRVTHDYHPSRTPNLYEVTVTLENISGNTIADIPYRRVFDWDIFPTPFSECTTVQPDPSLVKNLVKSSNDGFMSSNPYATFSSRAYGSASGFGPFTDLGPQDHGAAFQFQFGPLATGESVTFNTYYGAAANEAGAKEALGIVGAEVYSFGKPKTASGGCADTPNVYIFAFAAVGGEKLFTEPPTLVPSHSPSISLRPSSAPSLKSSYIPSIISSEGPSESPSKNPSDIPSISPIAIPSKTPSDAPTIQSSYEPSTSPSKKPTITESRSPSSQPSFFPSDAPTLAPTNQASKMPSLLPSHPPSVVPSSFPSDAPTLVYSHQPSKIPSLSPSYVPSTIPTINPTKSPIIVDTDGDGLSDNYENDPNPHMTDPKNPDTDGDGLSDSEEEDHRTDPNNPDTDGDGLRDGYEVNVSFTDPLEKQPTKSPSTSPTASPSDSPSNYPSASPSIYPTSLPSTQPSIVEEIVKTPGSLSTNVDICSFSEADLAAFSGAIIATIKSFACPGADSTCEAELASVCGGEVAGRLQNLMDRSYRIRQLQSTNWQVEYVVTEIFTCERASCVSPADQARVSAITTAISTNMNDSIGSGKFREVLRTKIIESSDLDNSVVNCLLVWGTVGEPETSVGKTGTGVFYPDWETYSGTCLEDGNEPGYMKNSKTWLFDSLEGCCARYFSGWNYNKCINLKGSGLWYVSHLTAKCVTDCEVGNGETCGGLANPISDDLYTNPRDCCASQLVWRFTDFCEADSLLSTCYTGTGLYYQGDDVESEVCVRDCDPSVTGDTTCGGLVEDSFVVLHDTAEACCTAEYNWMDNVLCAARSDQLPLKKYWPDMTKGKCFKDSEVATRGLDVPIFDSIYDCCNSGIFWLGESSCLMASGNAELAVTGSNKFYVDWVIEKCVQDCEGAAPCGGLAKSWDFLYNSVSECCSKLTWVTSHDCNSTT